MHLKGLIAAPHTPMTASGQVAPDVVPRLAEHLARQGVVGVFVNGSTGEWPALTVAERMRLAEAWATQAPKHGLTAILHLGALAEADALELARHAADREWWAVSALAPCFFKPDLDALLDHFARVAETSGHRFTIYHIPALTGVTHPAWKQLELGVHRIPRLAGVKFTAYDLYDLQRCLTVAPERLQVFYGHDECLLAALALGVEAAVGSTYNYAAPLYRAMIEAFEAGKLDEARACAARSVAMVNAVIDAGLMAAGKAIVSAQGVPVGRPRPPFRDLEEVARAGLFAEIARLGIDIGPAS